MRLAIVHWQHSFRFLSYKLALSFRVFHWSGITSSLLWVRWIEGPAGRCTDCVNRFDTTECGVARSRTILLSIDCLYASSARRCALFPLRRVAASPFGNCANDGGEWWVRIRSPTVPVQLDYEWIYRRFFRAAAAAAAVAVFQFVCV